MSAEPPTNERLRDITYSYMRHEGYTDAQIAAAVLELDSERDRSLA